MRGSTLKQIDRRSVQCSTFAFVAVLCHMSSLAMQTHEGYGPTYGQASQFDLFVKYRYRHCGKTGNCRDAIRFDCTTCGTSYPLPPVSRCCRGTKLLGDPLIGSTWHSLLLHWGDNQDATTTTTLKAEAEARRTGRYSTKFIVYLPLSTLNVVMHGATVTRWQCGRTEGMSGHVQTCMQLAGQRGVVSNTMYDPTCVCLRVGAPRLVFGLRVTTLCASCFTSSSRTRNTWRPADRRPMVPSWDDNRVATAATKNDVNPGQP
ncbi:hypothetical protein OG21DRAFT_338381 [Imleria badia]|nr:hypothetical protein OG21DRAFT_338381 [Imleria badia]